MQASGPDSKVVVRSAVPSAGGHGVVPMAGSPAAGAVVVVLVPSAAVSTSSASSALKIAITPAMATITMMMMAMPRNWRLRWTFCVAARCSSRRRSRPSS